MPAPYEPKFYLVRGRSRRAIELYNAAWDESHRQLDEWQAKIGAVELVWGSSSYYPSMPELSELPAAFSWGVVGARFAGEPPIGWHRRARGFYAPNPRTVAGRKLLVEMFSLITPNFPRALVGGDICIPKQRGNGFDYLSADVEQLGTEFVVAMHPEAPPPVDGIPLTKAKYRLLKMGAEKDR